ncbi:serine hydrolase domain-containing protein [Sediminibacillus albus]|uniref:CubicO group peptidase, beta-lactamase class C family n=1 Tax=Sediminibacillus albus TaxID=407036 RepID=A0A1G8YKA4_9BACI|nr:serine hydrolase domain-containing protein [Sediminibacillus albus]SDK03097.1 CubicO group peptidase, beta-lactamase class C family [Sediminibacillus albus]
MNHLDEIFAEYIRDDYFAGGVCCISVKGNIIFHKAYGLANRTNQTKLKKDTIFDLASVTKIITTTMILQLITNKRLSLATCLRDCLPHTSINPILSPITIQQLLTHTSGLKAWHPFYAHLPNKDLFKVLEDIKLTHDSDEKVVYSDLNFILLGEVIKYLVKDHLEYAIKKYLADPLELSTLTYHPRNQSNIAATEFGNKTEMAMCKEIGVSFEGWRNTNEPIVGKVNDGNAYYYFQGESGHAGLFSCVEDLIKIGNLYLKGGVYKNERLIDSGLVQRSMKNQMDGRGLGWQIGGVFPEGCGHTGFTGTSIWVVPEKEMVVGLLTNRLHTDFPKNVLPFRRAIFEAMIS